MFSRQGSWAPKLVSLPVNRDGAWRAMETIRQEAASAGTAREVAGAFEVRFGVSLAELEELYRVPVWKDSLYGGNKWAPICGAVRDLVEASVAGNSGRVGELLEAILRMAHNTGTVETKLASLSGPTGP
jgi:hypothetical protein